MRLTGAGLVTCGAPVSKTIAYETFYVDQPNGALRTDPTTPPKTFGIGDLSLILAIGIPDGPRFVRPAIAATLLRGVR